MSFLENIFDRLHQAGSAPVLREIRHGAMNSISGDELLSLVQEARNFLIARGTKKAIAALYWLPTVYAGPHSISR